MIITNQATNPMCKEKFPKYPATIIETADENHWTYTNQNPSDGWIKPQGYGINMEKLPPDMIIACQFKENDHSCSIESATKISDENGLLVVKTKGKIGTFHSIVIPTGGSVTPLKFGIYSPQDWETMKSLGLDYFDGDTQPL